MKIYVLELVGPDGLGHGIRGAYTDPERAVGGGVDAMMDEGPAWHYEVLELEDGEPVALVGQREERGCYAKVWREGKAVFKKIFT